MFSKNWSRTPVALMLAAAVLSAHSMFALAALAQETRPSAEITVNGKGKVNGVSVISGGTVFSGDTVEVEPNSTVTISGKFGRVELLSSAMFEKATFSDSALSGTLAAGRARVSAPQGVAVSVMTKDGSAVADSAQASAFSIDVECGNTIVATQAGKVELRSGTEAKQIAAGSQDTAGQAAPGTRCARLSTVGTGLRAISGGALAAILAAAGGAIAAGIIAATSDNNDLNFGGNVTVVSPVQ
ncbi:MAG: hypothetical protein WKF30_14565 [Pyrinomonadaceae bacterium]